jgi:hypothetical protein
VYQPTEKDWTAFVLWAKSTEIAEWQEQVKEYEAYHEKTN